MAHALSVKVSHFGAENASFPLPPNRQLEARSEKIGIISPRHCDIHGGRRMGQLGCPL
jgi:hypothetical protein